MDSTITSPAQFLASFRTSGGWYDERIFSLARFDGMGWGGIAVEDIPIDTPLFHIPLKQLLTPYTSDLHTKLSEEEWQALGEGWGRLILVMMYETSLGNESRWADYLASMPLEFNTPMFWSEVQRKYLDGTDIQGSSSSKQDEEYYECLAPILKTHPELFPPDSPHFSLAQYHIQAHRILSRSFTIPLSWSASPHSRAAVEDESENDEWEEDEETVAVMVPMADMLNAAYERDNSHLFGNEGKDASEDVPQAARQVAEEYGKGYTMITTKAIKKGEQIYNTYAAPPNSELLKKYGYVDIQPLPEKIVSRLQPEELGDWPFGNPADEVTIELELIVDALVDLTKVSKEQLEERIGTWVEADQPDSFALGYDDEDLDPSFIQFIRIIVNPSEAKRLESKGKLPSSVLDDQVAKAIELVLDQREGQFPQSIQDDIKIITSTETTVNPRSKDAAIVRLGEKRVLRLARRALQVQVARDMDMVREERMPAGRRRKGGEDQGDVEVKKRKS